MRGAPGIGFSKSMSDRDATGFIGGALLGRFIAQLCSTWFGFFFILPLLLPFILLLLVIPAAIRLIRLLIFGTASLVQQSRAARATRALDQEPQPSKLPNSAMALSPSPTQSQPTYPIKLMGHITWTYPDRRLRHFPSHERSFTTKITSRSTATAARHTNLTFIRLIRAVLPAMISSARLQQADRRASNRLVRSQAAMRAHHRLSGFEACGLSRARKASG